MLPRVEIEHAICWFYMDCIQQIRATPNMVFPFLGSSDCGDLGGSSNRFHTPPMYRVDYVIVDDEVCYTNKRVEY